MGGNNIVIDPQNVGMTTKPVTDLQQRKDLQIALDAIKESRKKAIDTVFKGRKLVPKKSKFLEATKDVAGKAKNVKSSLSKLGLDTPDINLETPNFDLFKGINFKKLTVPRLSIPKLNLEIPNITLGELPDWDINIINKLRIKLPSWHNRHLSILMNVHLGALIGALLDRIPDLEPYYISFQLEKIFGLNLKLVLPKIWFVMPDLGSVEIPNFNINLDGLTIKNPISIDLASIEIPGFNMPQLRRIPGFGRVLKLMVELFDVADFSFIADLFGEVFTDIITDFVTSALPIIGAIKSGVKAANEWRKCAHIAYKAHKVNTQKQYLLQGNAQLAAEGVKRLLVEDSAHHGVLAAIKTAQFGTQTAGLFADLGAATGPIVAAGAAVATMCEKIVFIGLEFKRIKAGNALLKSDQITSKLFDVTPVLGCFYLTCVNTSDILGVLVEDITTDRDWMLKWGQNKTKYIDPLQKEARRFIQASHFTLEPPPAQNFGLFEPPGKLDKLKKSFMARFRKK